MHCIRNNDHCIRSSSNCNATQAQIAAYEVTKVNYTIVSLNILVAFFVDMYQASKSKDSFDWFAYFVPHLFGGSLSGHVQSTAADGGGSRCKGSGRADKEGGNSELHVVKGMNVKKWASVQSRCTAARLFFLIWLLCSPFIIGRVHMTSSTDVDAVQKDSRLWSVPA